MFLNLSHLYFSHERCCIAKKSEELKCNFEGRKVVFSFVIYRVKWWHLSPPTSESVCLNSFHIPSLLCVSTLLLSVCLCLSSEDSPGATGCSTGKCSEQEVPVLELCRVTNLPAIPHALLKFPSLPYQSWLMHFLKKFLECKVLFKTCLWSTQSKTTALCQAHACTHTHQYNDDGNASAIYSWLSLILNNCALFILAIVLSIWSRASKAHSAKPFHMI